MTAVRPDDSSELATLEECLLEPEPCLQTTNLTAGVERDRIHRSGRTGHLSGLAVVATKNKGRGIGTNARRDVPEDAESQVF